MTEVCRGETRYKRQAPQPTNDCLQARAVEDLHVDGELAARVVEDKDTDGATAGLEGVVEAGVEVGLVNDSEALLDIAGLGHGDDVAVLHVEDSVLLEDRAEHGLDDDAGGRVGDKGALLVKLLGEEVNTEVSVLASGGGGGDSDDLAGAALEHQEVTEADVVARDGDGVGGLRARGLAAGALVDINIDVIVAGVSDLVSQLVNASAEGVVVTVLVVVTHLVFLGGCDFGSFNGLFGDLHVLLVDRARRGSVNGVVVDLSVFSSTVLGTGRGSVNGEVVNLSLLSGVVLGSGRASVNGEVVDFSLLSSAVLGSRRASVNSEVVDFCLLGGAVLGSRRASVNSKVVDFSLLGSVVVGGRRATFDGVVVDLEVLRSLELGTGGSVYGEVVGAETFSVFALSKINGGRVVGMTAGGVDFNVGVGGCVFRRRLRSTLLFDNSMELLLLETGTAVTFFFTCDMDLFFAVALLSARRKFSGGRDRRVLTFPSGWLLLGEFGLCCDSSCRLSLGLGIRFPICRWEDAEGDGDASLKVQDGDF